MNSLTSIKPYSLSASAKYSLLQGAGDIELEIPPLVVVASWNIGRSGNPDPTSRLFKGVSRSESGVRRMAVTYPGRVARAPTLMAILSLSSSSPELPHGQEGLGVAVGFGDGDGRPLGIGEPTNRVVPKRTFASTERSTSSPTKSELAAPNLIRSHSAAEVVLRYREASTNRKCQ